MAKIKILKPKKQRYIKGIITDNIKKIVVFLQKKIALILLFIVIVFIFYKSINFLYIDKINIVYANENYTNIEQLKLYVKPLVKNKIFLNLWQIKNDILHSFKFIKKLKINRKLNSINITITNFEIVANYLSDNNKTKGYITKTGRLIIINKTIKNNKYYIISNKSQAIITYNNSKKYFNILGIKIKKIINNNKIDTIVLNNGAKIIVAMPNKFIRLKKLKNIYYKLMITKKTIIDLRYKDAFVKIN